MIPIRHTGWFHFDPEDPIYRDHFPGRPVVPGTLITAAFLKAVEHLGLKALALRRFRFKAFVPPGTYIYELVIAEDTIRCVLMQENREMATGKIRYEI